MSIDADSPNGNPNTVSGKKLPFDKTGYREILGACLDEASDVIDLTEAGIQVDDGGKKQTDPASKLLRGWIVVAALLTLLLGAFLALSAGH
jgi:hypothetical protein